MFMRMPILLVGCACSVSLVASACGSSAGPTSEPTSVFQTASAPTQPVSVPTQRPPTVLVAAAATARPTLPPTNTTAPVRVPSGELTLSPAASVNYELLKTNGNHRIYLDIAYDSIIGSKQATSLDQSGFANSWTLSQGDKGTVITLKTRDGITFHSGTKATAHDVKATIERAKIPGTDIGNVGRPEIISFEAPDDNTFILRLNRRDIYYHVSQLSWQAIHGPNYLLNGKYYAEVGEGGYNKKPDGTGPYKFKDIVVGDRIVYEAIDKHWFLGVPRVKTVTYRFFPEDVTRLAAFKTGTLDLITIGAQSLPEVKGVSGAQVFEKDIGPIGFEFRDQWRETISGGYGKNPLSDARVRVAIGHYGVDREAILKSFLGGLGSLAVTSGVAAFNVEWESITVPKYDPTKAKALLAEAGYANGFKMDLIVHTPYSVLPVVSEIAEAIAVMWEQLGIKVTRIPMSTQIYFQKLATENSWANAPTAFCCRRGVTSAVPSIPSVASVQAISAASRDPDVTAVIEKLQLVETTEEYITLKRQYNRIQVERAINPGLAYISSYQIGNQKIPKWDNTGMTGVWNLETMLTK